MSGNMSAFVQRGLFVFLVLLAARGDGLRAQWQIVAANAVPHLFGGAIDYKGGIIWAGGHSLVFSADSGKTWTKTNFTAGNNAFGGILAISFLDSNIGIVSARMAGLYLTRDRGQTWNLVSNNTCINVAFSHHSSAVYALSQQPSVFMVSYDTGATWSQVAVPSEGYDFIEGIDGTLYINTALGNSPGTDSGFVSVSHDSGATWTPQLPELDADSYSMEIDSCDPDRVYIVNENWRWPGDDSSKVYSSMDAAQSWQVTLSHPILYLAGSIANSGNALYVGTLVHGILRSMDRGNSWTNIGGPKCPGDCRGIAAISDNIIFVMDSIGNIWATFNSGGDTVTNTSYVNERQPLTFTTADELTDTIGNSVSVPITIDGFIQPEHVNLVLHYDTTLRYQGSFDALNTKLDIPGEQWSGRSELNIAMAQSGVVAGYAQFAVFVDSGAKLSVTFDSLKVLSASSSCEYVLPAAVTSIITPPSGCGAEILSELLENGQLPEFSIRPNPTMGDVELTSSLDLGNADVEIYDMLGMQRGELFVMLKKDAPATFSLPDAAGIYYIRIHSIAGVRSMSVVVTK